MVEAQPGDEVVSGAQLALLIGCRPSYIVELKRKGRLVPAPTGKGYLRAASLALYRETADPSRAGVAARHAAARAAGGSVDAEVSEEDGVTDLPTSDAARRARALADKAEVDARTAELDLLERQGQLLPADAVEQLLSEAATGLRVALERMADTLAPQLAATADETRCRQLVWDEVHHTLEELSRGFRAAAQAAREEVEHG